jgi:hypothetical protein
VEFVEAPLFTQLVAEYLGDDDYRELQRQLAQDPQAGEVIPGSGGFRKLRWRDTRRGKGKRGGLRVIYYYFATDAQIWMITIYGKDEIQDLGPVEKRALKAAIGAETRQRARRRSGRR